jgi:hypothetical protein
VIAFPSGEVTLNDHVFPAVVKTSVMLIAEPLVATVVVWTSP